MLKLDTLRFGQIDVKAKEIFSFTQGMPGFENLRRFALLTPDPELPLSFLQSVEDGDVAFIITNPFIFYKDYEFDISEEDQSQLQVRASTEVEVWSIVTVRDTLETATINLLAPIVLNVKKQIGKQVILVGSDYESKHPLLSPGISSPIKEEAGC